MKDTITINDDPLNDPEGYRAGLIKSGILPKPEEAPETDDLKAMTELKDNRKAVRDSRGRVCRQNADGTLERVHFHQRLVSATNSKGEPGFKSEIYMPGETWKDSRGREYTLCDQGTIICTSVRIKGKSNKKAYNKEVKKCHQHARRVVQASVIN
jgi:hypothetical protein